MGDSDDDFDSRRNRDKFRRERDDFSGNRGHNNRGSGEWNDGRDRSNRFRGQYSSGPPQGRDFPPRYNRSPARYDMSPPQNKRLRRDWDTSDQSSSSRFDSNIGSPYLHSGGGFPSNTSSNIPSNAEQLNKESSDSGTQPPLLSFKNFLLDQDDNIEQEEAVKRYNVYKTDFKKTQIAEFFTAHKNEEWFKYKYHPDEHPKRHQEQKQIIQRRLDIFMDLYNKGYLNNVSVDIDNQQALIKFLDTAVIKMEGGGDQDLRLLDIVTSSHDENTVKQSSEKIDNENDSKKISDNKRKREDSKSDDETISNAESKDTTEMKSSSQDTMHEAGEVPDASRLLHRTTSIFFRHLTMQTTNDDLENMCKQYAGFRRVCITDPAPERKFFRRGWATFDYSVQIRNICYELNLTKLHDTDVGAIVNRELKNRVRTISGIAHHKTIVRNDLRLITKIIKQLDAQWNIWESNENDHNEKKVTISDDSEISSSTMNTSSIQNKNPIGFISYNPLLKNITEYLVEEGDAEEEELLGDASTTMENNSNAFEIDKELTKVLDRLILYLRVVYSVDYYNCADYTQEDSMPNRCGVIHVRGGLLSTITQKELTNFMQQFESRLTVYMDSHEKIDDDEALKLGAKNEENEIEKFMDANCQEVSKDKWSCPLSGKKFKGPEFVRKHILNKHHDKIDEVKKEMIYFNNYLYDPKRPQLPEHSSNRPGATAAAPHPSGLPLPTPMTVQPLFTRASLWPTMSAPPHSGSPGYYPNQFHQARHHRPSFMYQGLGGSMHRPLNSRPLRSYEDLDAPSEI
ncbi:unnamed protein product [Rotaria magnacalcarata]|uniref:Arsenite-resistance protein 2 homolog n=1 Tax=Rotaria magnacalcarata TaxID=392030 RepID=A0A815TP05_9BILA|nr:unnamed protein product [Rotaria magnacalcarata]CAF1509122.1 unnamed protein product [Rotaria magnacalcarata]